LMQCGQILFGLSQQDTLRNFNFQAFWRQLRVHQRANHSIHDIGFCELNRRKVDRDLDTVRHPHRIVARLCQNPLAQLNDQTRFLGQGNEISRRDNALSRMVPSQQSFDSFDTPRFVFHNRLIKELKLVMPNGLAKVVLQYIAAVSFYFELLTIDAEAVPSIIFCFIECEIGILEDLVAAIAVFGRKRYSNAASNNNLWLFEPVWCTHSLDEPFRQSLNAPVDGFLADYDEHGKFIATKPGG